MLDHERKEQVLFTRDMLVNQVRRESPMIAASFDRLWLRELERMCDLFSKTLVHLFAGRRVAEANEDALRHVCVRLLSNAIKSYSAAVELLRCGYRLQPGILVRNILETVSTVLHLFINRNDLPRFLEGKLESSGTITTAKMVLPDYGRAYGFFSNNYIHIGEPHRMDHLLEPYTDSGDEAVRFNLLCLRWSIWLLFVTSEMVFFDIAGPPRYWRRIDADSYAFDPSPEEQRWFEEFIRPTHRDGEGVGRVREEDVAGKREVRLIPRQEAENMGHEKIKCRFLDCSREEILEKRKPVRGREPGPVIIHHECEAGHKFHLPYDGSGRYLLCDCPTG